MAIAYPSPFLTYLYLLTNLWCSDVFRGHIIHFMTLLVFYTLKNLTKIEVFWCFQQVYKETSGMKWVIIFWFFNLPAKSLNLLLTSSFSFCCLFNVLCWFWTHRVKSSLSFIKACKHWIVSSLSLRSIESWKKQEVRLFSQFLYCHLLKMIVYLISI